ncbi:hypothetical protein BGZ94_003711, partial [Podila epigama]
MSGNHIIPTPSSSLVPSAVPTFGIHNHVQNRTGNVVFDAREISHNPHAVRVGGFRGPPIPEQLSFGVVPAASAEEGSEERVPTHGHEGDVEEEPSPSGQQQGGSEGGRSQAHEHRHEHENGQGQVRPTRTNIAELLRHADGTRPNRGRFTLPVETP